MPDPAAVVRGIYAVMDTDFEAAAQLVTEDFAYINPPDAVEPGVGRGRAQVVAALEHMHSSFQELRHEPLEIVVEGNRVLAKVAMIARGRASGANVDRVEGHVLEVREDKVASLRWFNTWDEAVAAFSDG